MAFALQCLRRDRGYRTGRLSQHASQLSEGNRNAVVGAITHLFDEDPLIGDGISVLSLLAQPLWLVAATSAALALNRAGARRVTVVTMSLSVLFAAHGGPLAVLGLLALGVALATANTVRDATTALRSSEASRAHGPAGEVVDSHVRVGKSDRARGGRSLLRGDGRKVHTYVCCQLRGRLASAERGNLEQMATCGRPDHLAAQRPRCSMASRQTSVRGPLS